jgi:hypothetical protein
VAKPFLDHARAELLFHPSFELNLKPSAIARRLRKARFLAPDEALPC